MFANVCVCVSVYLASAIMYTIHLTRDATVRQDQSNIIFIQIKYEDEDDAREKEQTKQSHHILLYGYSTKCGHVCVEMMLACIALA